MKNHEARKPQPIATALFFIIASGSSVVSSLAWAKVDLSNALIQIKSVAEIDGKNSEITLQDLIVAKNVSDPALIKLGRIRLADTPRAGESRVFTGAGLEQVFRPSLRKIEAETGEQIALRIPTRVTVTRKSLEIKNAEVREKITAQMSELCADCLFEISSLSLPSLPPSLPSGSSWSIRMSGDIPKGSFSVPLEIIDDDMARRSYWVTGTLTVRRKVPVSARVLAAGEKLRSEDYNLQIKDITFANDIAASEGELGTSVIARSIAAGQVIWRCGLRRELAVKQGDAVKIIAGEEGWQVTTEGIVQGSGYIGDRINVKVNRTQKLVSGFLTDRGTIEVR